MGNCFKGTPVKCCLVSRGRVLLAKHRLSSGRVKEMTDGFSNMVISANLQPDCAKGITVRRTLTLQFHKGYNVLWVSNYNSL